MIMQGDSRDLEITIRNEAGEVITSDDVSDVEICVGSLKKRFAKNEVRYENEKWLFPLTQEETFKLNPARTKIQLRVKFTDGTIEGCDLGYKNIHESLSKEVL